MATICLCLGRVRLTFCSIASQPANQLASCNWPDSQPCDKISTCQTSGWSDSWWQEDRSLTTLDPSPGSQHSHWFPLGSDLPEKARQVTQMNSAASYIPLALCSGTVYSFVSTSPNHIFLHTMLRNVIWTMFSPDQLLISFHHKSDVLLHQCTTFEELLLSPEIRNAKEKSLNKGQPVQMN